MRDAGTDWQQWLAAHAPAALLYARQFAGSPQDAEDALHDGFVRFWEKCASARDPVAFLYVCIRSAALDCGRRNRRRVRRDEAAGRALPQFAPPDPGDFARQEMVEAALAQLPQAQRETVVLKIWAGLTFQQIAGTSKESINTVAARYRYAMEKLSAILSPEVEHER